MACIYVVGFDTQILITILHILITYVMFTLIVYGLLLVMFCILVYTAQLNKDVISSCQKSVLSWSVSKREGM